MRRDSQGIIPVYAKISRVFYKGFFIIGEKDIAIFENSLTISATDWVNLPELYKNVSHA